MFRCSPLSDLVDNTLDRQLLLHSFGRCLDSRFRYRLGRSLPRCGALLVIEISVSCSILGGEPSLRKPTVEWGPARAPAVLKKSNIPLRHAVSRTFRCVNGL